MHQGLVRPDQILAVTFTRQAAGEMTERLHQLLGREFAVNDLAIKTFHALGAQILQSQGLAGRQVISEEERRPLLQAAARPYGFAAKTLDLFISRSKQEVLYPSDLSPDIVLVARLSGL